MEPGGFQTGMTEPGARERQMRKGWDDLSDELKKEYGKEFWDKGTRTFSAFLPFLRIAILLKGPRRKNRDEQKMRINDSQ